MRDTIYEMLRERHQRMAEIHKAMAGLTRTPKEQWESLCSEMSRLSIESTALIEALERSSPQETEDAELRRGRAVGHVIRHSVKEWVGKTGWERPPGGGESIGDRLSRRSREKGWVEN